MAANDRPGRSQPVTRLARVAAAYRSHAGVAQKAPIQMVRSFGETDWLTGPGDDGAHVPTTGGSIVVGGEAMFPPFVEADPRGAGFAAVLANVNDLAAMGAEPRGIVDTVIGPEDGVQLIFEGMRDAAAMYEVPVIGGHVTVRPGPAAVSAFGIGEATRLLSVRNVAPGQALLFAGALDGTMRNDFPFFASFDQRRSHMAGDVRVLAQVAAAGAAVAAKDISMAGLLGSLAMLLEARQAGATVDLDTIPAPAGVDLDQWLIAFPAFGFLLCTEPAAAGSCAELFDERGLVCRQIGMVTGDGRLEIVSGDRSEVLAEFPQDGPTGLPPL